MSYETSFLTSSVELVSPVCFFAFVVPTVLADSVAQLLRISENIQVLTLSLAILAQLSVVVSFPEKKKKNSGIVGLAKNIS
jgi:hypothetical protein